MKMSHRWLSRHISALQEPSQVMPVMEQLGIEVAEATSWGDSYRPVELVEVVSRKPHPHADRLSLVTVVRGSGEDVLVVTGASNGFEGQRLWYAPPGTTLPNGQELGVRDFRGISSPGMLVSASELGFVQYGGDLWTWDGPERLGTTFFDVLGGGDTVYDLELTPNLAQYYQSVRNVAHDLAGLAGWAINSSADAYAYGDSTHLATVKALTDCPLYGLIEMDIVPGVSTPLWMQALLSAIGQRLIHPAVDMTNFILWDLGQPLHAFDRDRVTLPISVRRAVAGEQLDLLDGSLASLTPDDLVICDATGPIALAGVMGGKATAISNETTRILVETAHFRSDLIFRTMRRRQLVTDAASHFGKGTDPATVLTAPSYVLDLWKSASIISHVGPSVLLGDLPQPSRVGFEPDRIGQILGVDWTVDDMQMALKAFGINVHDQEVLIPSWRHDVEGIADLAEEVARFKGLGSIPERLPRIESSPGQRDAFHVIEDKLRTLWSQAGYWETFTRTFSSPEREAILNRHPEWTTIRLTNPLREEEQHMRTDLLTSMLEVLQSNRSRRDTPLALFEVGTVFHKDSKGPQEQVELVVVHTLDPVEQFPPVSEVSVYHLKGALEWVALRMGWALRLVQVSDPPQFLHPGRSLAIYAPPPIGSDHPSDPIGWLGELRPRIAQHFRGRRVAVLFMEVGQKASAVQKAPLVPMPSRFPEVVRDLSLVVPDRVAYEEISQNIRQQAPQALRQLTVIDRFVGEFGQSLTVRMVFQSDHQTLTDSFVDDAVSKILSKLDKVGVKIRQ